jgi:hypothetical protein
VSEVKLYKVENRLAAMFKRPGGKSVREALVTAETRVQAKLEELASTLPQSTARLRAMVDTAPDAADGLDRVYEAANQVFSLAGALGYAELADAAYRLCDLIEGFRDGGAVNWKAVRVHADAIRLLGSLPRGGQASDLASGLKALGAHFSKREE